MQLPGLCHGRRKVSAWLGVCQEEPDARSLDRVKEERWTSHTEPRPSLATISFTIRTVSTQNTAHISHSADTDTHFRPTNVLSDSHN